MRYLLLFLVVCLVGGLWFFFWWKENYGYRSEVGTLVKEAPTQKPMTAPKAWNHKGYRITALAEFEMTGRVLMTDRYYSGRESELSPVDFTLGWGPMSNAVALRKVHMMHLDRYYHWETDGDWPDKDTISKNSANMHMIPADDGVDRLLKGVRRENLVHFKGYLVRCEGTDGWQWVSSLTRDDTGPGACEVVWVESLDTR